MNIAVIGAGNVGSALGAAWARKGHRVTYGVREPGSEKARALAGKNASVAGLAEAARGAEVVVLATPWGATKEAIQTAGTLAGKTVIDCTNPLLPDLSGLEVGHTRSGGELVAEWTKGASVFKTFNHTGAGTMASQAGFAQKPVMFVAGDDPARKRSVLQLVTDAGFEAVDAGELKSARLLEPLAMLWIQLAFRQGLGRDFAFGLLRRAK